MAYNPIQDCMSCACSDISKYEILVKVGQGTFGEVHKARNRRTGEIVAIKRIISDGIDGIPITTIREVKIFQEFIKHASHENLVKYIEVCSSSVPPNGISKFYGFKFYLVFEFCEHDLAGILSNADVEFSLGHRKMIMKQLLSALYYIHESSIIHRDVKTSNVLVTRTGVVKLADFGLARPVSKFRPNPNFTNKVVTRWYRPPELLLGEVKYGSAVDIWAAGCIMAELWKRKPILQGETDQHQLKIIIELCGSINPVSFPDVENLELYRVLELKQDKKRKVKEQLQAYVDDAHAIDLLDKLLTIDPVTRINSDTALCHDFFYDDPLPCELTEMLSKFTRSMFEYGTRDVNRHPVAACHQNTRVRPKADNEQYQDRVF